MDKKVAKENKKICEEIWSQNKYLVLSKSHKIYLRIRNYLKEDIVYPDKIIGMIEEADALKENKKDFRNSMLHIWGYFKRYASQEEKDRIFTLLDQYSNDLVTSSEVLDFMAYLLENYPNDYLMKSKIFQMQYSKEDKMKRVAILLEDGFE